MKRLIVLLFLIYHAGLAGAQTGSSLQENLADTIVDRSAIPSGRLQMHLRIAREQYKADASDGVHDYLVDREDKDKTLQLSGAIFTKVAQTIAYIENNAGDDLQKRRYLGRIIENLKIFNADINDGVVDIRYYDDLFEHTYQVIRGLNNRNLAGYVRSNIGRAMFTLASFIEGDAEASQVLMVGMANKYPESLIRRLRTINSVEAADAVVANAAPQNPKIILNYVTSTAVERDIVRRNKDPYVRTIIKIADSAKTPLKAIFFIEELFKGNIDIRGINQITEKQDTYFKKLIELRQQYFTSELRNIYDRELTHEASRYVMTMNELHNAGDAVRFKIIGGHNAREIYYIMVYGNDDLYTSSFLGCFNRMMQQMKPQAGNEFLDSIGRDKFRTFLRLCANYNTLSTFLGTIKDSSSKTALMREFVTGLDNTLERDLEGATDVANSFGSIHDSTLMQNMLEEIRLNRDRHRSDRGSKGYKIYHILYSMLTMSNDSLTRELGIPPITMMPFSSLANDSGVVVQQVFFYGDRDGQGVFNSYVGGFGAPNWKVKREAKWVKISSIKGKRVDIYANIPFAEPDDEMAQNALQEYLDSSRIEPTIIIHRGHSYHLPTTLEHINSHHKVVILGACGAYQNLSTVLNQSEDAHIVATKQIGAGKINGPIIRTLNERLLAGKDIDWVDMWAHLSKQFSGGETKALFDDYVPPYKNLGAIFLKAYKKFE